MYATHLMAENYFYGGLYTLVLVLIRPLTIILARISLAHLRTPRGKHVIIVLVDIFSKTTQIIACHKRDNMTYIAELFF